MRLIDADKVNDHIIGWVDLRDCPTIEAIPIEWVNQFVINTCKSSHDDSLPAFLYWLDKMVAKWRKENG